MNGDDMSRGMNQQSRKFTTPNKYNEKHSYSPSTNFNYNYNSSGISGYGNQQSQSHQKPRRPDHKFKGGGHHSGSNDKLVKQNDQIIKLLKEIRDRLPPPPEGTVTEADPELDQDTDDCGEDMGNERDMSDDDADDIGEQNPTASEDQDLDKTDEK